MVDKKVTVISSFSTLIFFLLLKLGKCYQRDGQQLGMFGLLMNMLSPCLQRILYIVTVILFDSSSHAMIGT